MFNVVAVMFNYQRYMRIGNTNIPTYRENNYPVELTIEDMEAVEIAIQETVRFDLNASSDIADKEWHSLYGRPYTIHLGPDQRIFALAFYHQFHCLRAMQFAITHPDDATYTVEHIHHCLNYLRQHLLCAADDEIERGDFLEWGFIPGLLETTRVCRDWDKVNDVIDKALIDFEKSSRYPLHT
ncbi:hypothetical protein DFH08DRAFT_805072 [Mycena albidolilacea]|uniref:Uncharacterized protein n=1 Tax=Mycena albidolilacea TaxID=1033008 RepID=A0AAD7EV45_9AGAR|nr:hypothetical protein DFH08DRAFT_805072 [Mycena albidolilacea]